MWFSRINIIPFSTTLFQERSLDECEIVLSENTNNWLNYLNTVTENELNRIVDFIFSIDNSQQRISVSDSLIHIVHHSSYHRGHIVSNLKGSLEKLPLVTYIKYAIENKN